MNADFNWYFSDGYMITATMTWVDLLHEDDFGIENQGTQGVCVEQRDDDGRQIATQNMNGHPVVCQWITSTGNESDPVKYASTTTMDA